MKTKRRHELQHNALDAELVKIIDFIKKHGKAIVLTVLTVVLATCVIWYAAARHAAKVSGPRRQYDRLKAMPLYTADDRATLLAGFEELAVQTGNQKVAALACVEAAELCILQQVSGEAGPGALKKARGYYRRVVAEFSDVDVAPARAYLGLARLADEEGDLAAAKANYQKVIDLGDRASQVASELASQCLAALDEREAIRLATTRPVPPATQPTTGPAIGPPTTTQPATKPAPVPTTQPATKPAPAPTTQPATRPAPAPTTQSAAGP